jgi:hypothetical protein
VLCLIASVRTAVLVVHAIAVRPAAPHSLLELQELTAQCAACCAVMRELVYVAQDCTLIIGS